MTRGKKPKAMLLLGSPTSQENRLIASPRLPAKPMLPEAGNRRQRSGRAYPKHDLSGKGVPKNSPHLTWIVFCSWIICVYLILTILGAPLYIAAGFAIVVLEINKREIIHD